MLILPLKFIREEDKKTIGLNLFNLAKLNHLGLPVIESVIAVPDQSIFENAVNKFFKNHPNLNHKSEYIKSEILKLPIPESIKNLEIAGDFLKSKTVFNVEKLWENLLEKWAMELISKLERNEKNIYHLTPQLIVFSANFTAFGKGYYDEDREHAIIKVESGKIDFHTSSAIENLIIVGNKKLVIPQIYYWAIEDGKIKIVKLAPFTQSEEEQQKENPVSLKDETKITKTATKIFLNFKDDNLTSFNTDGIILNINKIDNDLINHQILKIHQFDKNTKIIFSPETGLTHDQVLNYAKSFIFFKNKKNLDLQIILPETFSKDEYLNLKREFASLGIYSKGSLKLWKQFNFPGDFLNFEEYLDAGFDGAIIDVDKIAKNLIGLDAETILRDLKLDWFVTLEKFFKEFSLSQIIKSKKPVLLKGKLSTNEELLNYFIKSGVWGIAFENNVAGNFRDHIAFLEKQTIKRLSTAKI